MHLLYYRLFETAYLQGWATYMERLLIHHVYSPAARDFSFLLDFKSLQDALGLYADCPKYQRLVIEFEYGENPDDAYSRVPYDKGANFLLYLGKSLLYRRTRRSALIYSK